MDPKQSEQLVQAVAQQLAQGADPDQIEQQLAQKIDPQMAQQIVDQAAAMVTEQGDGGQEGQGGEGGGMQMIQQLLEQGVDPMVIMAVTQAILNMTPDEIKQMVSGLQQMAQQGGGQEQQGPPPKEQEQPQQGGQGMNF